LITPHFKVAEAAAKMDVDKIELPELLLTDRLLQDINSGKVLKCQQVLIVARWVCALSAPAAAV